MITLDQQISAAGSGCGSVGSGRFKHQRPSHRQTLYDLFTSSALKRRKEKKKRPGLAQFKKIYFSAIGIVQN